MVHNEPVAEADIKRSSHETEFEPNLSLGVRGYVSMRMANSVVNAAGESDDRFGLSLPVSHDPCLLSFRCKGLETKSIDDKALRRKGFLSFLDAFIDPLAGTQYVICFHPPMPKSAGGYFEQAGRHMAGVMHSVKGDSIVRLGRRTAKR